MTAIKKELRSKHEHVCVRSEGYVRGVGTTRLTSGGQTRMPEARKMPSEADTLRLLGRI